MQRGLITKGIDVVRQNNKIYFILCITDMLSLSESTFLQDSFEVILGGIADLSAMSIGIASPVVAAIDTTGAPVAGVNQYGAVLASLSDMENGSNTTMPY